VLAADAAPGPSALRALLEASHVHDLRPHRALTLAEQAVSVARGVRPQVDGRWLYRALCEQAYALSRVQRTADAVAALDEARALERRDWPAVTSIRRWIAEVSLAYQRGDPDGALHGLQERYRATHAAGHRSADPGANLLDAQLFAGRIDDAIRSGRALVMRLDGTRFEDTLALARLNLAAALLARDAAAEARAVCEAGWPQAPHFELQPYWGDYLALLAALERRPADAARLAGYADAGYVRKDDKRQANEAAAIERAHALVRAALGEAEAARLHAEGAGLRDDEVAALAFGRRE
jgi:hypothetical protein